MFLLGLFKQLLFLSTFVALLALIAPYKVCAEKLALQDLLERAESNVFLVKDIAARRELAKLKLNQVTMERWLPSFEAQGFGGVVPDVNVDAAIRNQNSEELLFNFDSADFENDFALSNLGPFLQLEVKAIQPLYTWGKISSYYKMARRNVDLTEAQMNKLISQVRYLVKKAYYTRQLSQDSIAVLNEVKEKLSEAQEKVEELLIKNAENVEENDRLKIRVFMADVQNRSLDAFRGLKISKATLFELTGAAGEWSLDQESLSPELVRGLTKDGLISRTLRQKPQIAQLDQAIAIKRAEKGTIRSDLFPALFVAGEVDYAVAPGRTDVKNPYLSDPFNKFNLGVALGLKQDLGIYRTINKMKQVDAQIASLEAQKSQLEIMSKLKLEDAFERAVNAQKGISINEDAFRAARSWLTSTGLAFSLGTASTKDVLESYAAYFKARVDLLRAIYDLNMSLSELALASGGEVVERLK